MYGLITFAVYFLTTQLILIVVSIYCSLKYNQKSIQTLCEFKRKWIYLLVTWHLYDTASDIGVLVEWGIIAYDDTYYNIDMIAMFWTSIGFHIIYRFLLCGFSTVRFGYVPEDDATSSCGGCMWSILLSWTDMYIIKTVYDVVKYDEMEPNEQHKSVEIIKAIAESAPQIVLQSIFLSRRYSDPALYQYHTGVPVIVIISLIASIVSLSKSVYLDAASVADEAKKLDFKCKACNPTFNFMYVLRVLWRFNFLLTRMFMLVSLWLVLGALPFAIFLCVSTCIWCCCLCRLTDTGDCYGSGNYYVCCVACGFANPITRDFKANCYHFFEMIILMIIITIFSRLCAEQSTHEKNVFYDICVDQYTDNSYTNSFLIMAWICMIIDFILFFVLYYTQVFQGGLLDDIFQVFIEGQRFSPAANKRKTEEQPT